MKLLYLLSLVFVAQNLLAQAPPPSDVTLSASTFILPVNPGDGGTAYGALPGGTGGSFSLLDSNLVLYATFDNSIRGQFPEWRWQLF